MNVKQIFCLLIPLGILFGSVEYNTRKKEATLWIALPELRGIESLQHVSAYKSTDPYKTFLAGQVRALSGFFQYSFQNGKALQCPAIEYFKQSKELATSTIHYLRKSLLYTTQIKEISTANAEQIRTQEHDKLLELHKKTVIAVFILSFVAVFSLVYVIWLRYKTKKALLSQKEVIESQRKQLEISHEKLVETEKQLLQHEKMAKLGALSAGLAHEINNPINFISSGVLAIRNLVNELLVTLSRHESPAYLDEYRHEFETTGNSVKNGISRITRIVKNFQIWSSSGKISPQNQRIDVNVCVDNAIAIFQFKLANHQVQVVKDFGKVPDIQADESQVGEVLVNLIDNAIGAMENADERKLTVKTETRDNTVRISITDTGHGISPDISSRIFEPFFSTRPVMFGVGMGLYLSYNIVKAHQGSLDFTSVVGKGTTFVFDLPVKLEPLHSQAKPLP